MKNKFCFNFVKTIFTTILLFTNFNLATAQDLVAQNENITELVILHTNDHHGAIESKDGLAGLSQRASYIKSVREENTNVLLLDAGDINTGTAISNMFKAEPDILAYNYLNYDAVVFGNHEFDNDFSVLKKSD